MTTVREKDHFLFGFVFETSPTTCSLVAVVEAVKADLDKAPVTAKLRALLKIARKTALNANTVEKQDVEAAKAEGATDLDVHDTVLIAAAFCMYNRYVDGLSTFAPPGNSQADAYVAQGSMLISKGYGNAI